MQIILMIGYFVLGIFQLAACMAGLTDYLGLPGVIGFFLALFLAYLPLVGSVVGILGAVYAWHWEWWQALLLFFGVPIVGFLLIAMFTGLGAFLHRRSA